MVRTLVYYFLLLFATFSYFFLLFATFGLWWFCLDEDDDESEIFVPKAANGQGRQGGGKPGEE